MLEGFRISHLTITTLHIKTKILLVILRIKTQKKKRTQSVSKLNSYVAVYRIGRKAF